MSSEIEKGVANGAPGGDDFLYLAAFQDLVLERTHDLISVMDAAGVVVYASPSWRSIGWEPDELIGSPVQELVHPDDAERVSRAFAAIGRGGSVEAFTLRTPTRDGRWVWVESSGSPIHDVDGRVAYIVVTSRDVTEREELRARVAEVDALYRVADAVGRAVTLDELLSEAIGALLEATGADRAAVLLHDDDRVMRFRAWHGLSDAYRAATDGHSPWPPDTVDPQPLLVPRLADAGFDESLERAVRAEGVEALAFVPLVHGERLLGKFMLYHDGPHEWTPEEVQLCRTIANHLASATLRTRTQDDLRASSDQLATILRTVDEGIVVQTPSGQLVYANDAAARFVGFDAAAEFLAADREQVLARYEMLDENEEPLHADQLPGRRALAGEAGERVVCYRIRATGEVRWSIVRANPVPAPDGGVALAVSVIRDITAAKRAEQRARESLALLDGVFRTVPVGLVFWDTALRYVRVNEAFERMNGLAAADVIGRTAFDLRPEHAEQLGPLLRRVLDTSEPVLDVEVVGPSQIWMTSFFPVSDDHGELLGVACVSSDVTEQRRAEEERRRSAERAQFLARASDLMNESLDYEQTLGAIAEMAVPSLAGQVAIDLLDEDGSLRCVGAAHADPAQSRTVRELRRRYPPTAFDHPVQVAARTGEPVHIPDLQAHVEEMAQDEEHAAAIRALANTSGIVVPLIARGRTLGTIQLGTIEPQPPFDEADVELAVELGRRASLALDNARLFRQAQARAHAAEALEFVDDGVFLVDGDGVVRLWNPAAAAAFRVRPARAVGRPVGELISDWESLQDRIPVAEAERSRSLRAQTVPFDVAGTERWLSISAVRFPGGTVYAFRDLTEERRVEQLKSDFVATVSHELRTPLSAIYGAALTLRRSDVRLEESQRDGLLDVVANEADRLARIVNDILWASRLDSGQMGVAIESCDAARLARQVVETLGSHAPSTVSLELDAADGLPPVATDPDKLRQVLTNLVDNAVKYSPDGGLVTVNVSEAGKRIRFRVEDEGLGIPPGEHDRIFEKFFRLDPNLTRGVGGTGLGLYICRELVHRMHGRIWVTSDGRRGSTFTVELPVAG